MGSSQIGRRSMGHQGLLYHPWVARALQVHRADAFAPQQTRTTAQPFPAAHLAASGPQCRAPIQTRSLHLAMRRRTFQIVPTVHGVRAWCRDSVSSSTSHSSGTCCLHSRCHSLCQCSSSECSSAVVSPRSVEINARSRHSCMCQAPLSPRTPLRRESNG